MPGIPWYFHDMDQQSFKDKLASANFKHFAMDNNTELHLDLSSLMTAENYQNWYLGDVQ